MENCKEQIVVDFGDVYVNTKLSKFFEVRNDASINQVFNVEKYSERPKLDCGFSVTPVVSPTVKPGEIFKFRVEFTPKVVNMRCCDYFIIKHLFGVQTKVFTKASVKGPEYSMSCNHLKLICPEDKKSYSKKFEIKNIGSCVVNFQFIVDNSHSRVTFNPACGIILPSKNVYITVSYTPAGLGLFFKKIFCLIEYQEPIALDVFALWKRSEKNSPWDFLKENLSKCRSGYHSFMSGAINGAGEKDLPLLSNDGEYIDFGHCLPKALRQAEFSLTNNYNKPLSVIWNQGDLRKIFKIEPTQIKLKENSSVVFNATFAPSVKDMLYGAQLEAQVFVNDQLLPFSVDVNFKGDSFDEASCGWAAQYRVEPLCVVLPPCTPQPFYPSHSTLTIHRRGHLPLAFVFHPPYNSNFSVKPSQGLIYGDFQIIVVQFHPKNLNEAVYVEKWMLSFNSNENVNQCFVEFGGSIETPQLIINNGQDVVFPKVHPGSSYELLVDLYNPTRFSIWYDVEVLKGDSVIKVVPRGEMWPYEHKQVPWTFCPLGTGQLEALVSCTPSLGTDVQVKVTTAVIKAACEKTMLNVEPHGLVFQNVLLGYQEERSFEIINSGDSFIKGSLMWLSVENCNNLTDIEVRFQPDMLTLEPGTSTMVNVLVTPLTSGNKHFLIGYSTNDSSATPLLPAFIICVFPCLQISDLRHINTGPLFAKLQFWKALKIHKLNEMMRNLVPGQHHEVHMCLPSYQCTTHAIVVELLVENTSDVGVDMALSQRVTCDCKPVLTTVSFSRSKWMDKCPHKNQLSITPPSAHLKAKSYVILTIQAHYKTVGFVECLFSLSITPEHFEELSATIDLYLSRTSIPEATPFIDTIEPKESGNFVFNMRPVFIGEFYPFAQAFTVYNNTKQSVYYDVDATTLHGSPFKYIGELNTVAPKSNHYLLFTFLPSNCGIVEEEIKLTINNCPFKLILRGTGVSSVTEKYVDDQLLVPKKEKLIFLKSAPIYLSTSHINIGPIKPSCAQRHVMFFNNKTKDIISFKWNITKLPEVLELRVHPTKGALQPGGVVECRLVSYCKGWPCNITCVLTCVIASFSKYAKSVQSFQKYKEDLATCSDFFIITERGMENIDLAAPLEEWPRQDYITVSVTLDVKCHTVEDEEILPLRPSSVQLSHNREPLTNISEEIRLHINFVLENVLWEALKELYSKITIKRNEPLDRYIQIAEINDQTEVSVPCHILQTSLEDILYSAWQNLFQLSPRNSIEHLRRTLISQLQLYIRTGIFSDDSAMINPALNFMTGSFTSRSSGR